MAASEKIIYVYADWSNNPPVLIGRLFVNVIPVRGKSLFMTSLSSAV